MLSRIFHWMTGYACFSLEGQTARFLNIAVKSGLTIWRVQKREGKSIGYIKAKEYKHLRSIGKRCKSKIKCIYKRGLPFYTQKLSRRKGFLIGILAAMALCFYLSSFVWNIQVNGIENISPVQIEKAARTAGLYEGAHKKDFSPSAAEIYIMEQVPGISWISVNTDGCFVNIEIKEADEKPEISEENQPSDIIAEREGVIKHIEAHKGMKKVRIGEVVQKGQTLITGIYTENISPYTVKKSPVTHYVLRARGRVIAETVRNFQVSVERIKQIEVDSEEKTNSYFLFFGLKIPLGFHTSDNNQTRIYEHTNRFELLGEKLPIGIYKEKHVFSQTAEIGLTKEELKEEALFRLREQQKEQLKDSAKIIEETLDYQITQNGCILSAVCRLEEEIGVEQPALWNITDNG